LRLDTSFFTIISIAETGKPNNCTTWI
jgi:hypothetical protein